MTKALVVAGVHESSGRRHALDGLGLTVETGEAHGFLGPHGAGKATAIRILLGLLCADSGAAQLPGQDPWHDAVDLHRRLAHVPGAVGLWPGLTGGEAIGLLSRPRGGADRRRRDELIGRFGLDPVKRGRACSKGNRQKAAIAAAPASDPELLLLDELTAGLDPLMEVVPQDVIRRAKSAGRTVPFSSHVLAQAEKLADRVGIIRLGRRLRAGAVADGRGARLRTGAVGHRRGRLGPVRPAAPAARAVPVYASVTGYVGQLLRLPGLTRDCPPPVVSRSCPRPHELDASGRPHPGRRRPARPRPGGLPAPGPADDAGNRPRGVDVLTRMGHRDTAGYGGCATAALGTVTALYVWGASRRTRLHMGSGFEGQGRDLSVLWTELPLVLLAGALIPPVTWLLTLRLLRGRGAPRARVLIAATCTAGVLTTSAWGLHTWANPHDPDRVRLSGTPASDLDQ